MSQPPDVTLAAQRPASTPLGEGARLTNAQRLAQLRATRGAAPAPAPTPGAPRSSNAQRLAQLRATRGAAPSPGAPAPAPLPLPPPLPTPGATPEQVFSAARLQRDNTGERIALANYGGKPTVEEVFGPGAPEGAEDIPVAYTRKPQDPGAIAGLLNAGIAVGALGDVVTGRTETMPGARGMAAYAQAQKEDAAAPVIDMVPMTQQFARRLLHRRIANFRGINGRDPSPEEYAVMEGTAYEEALSGLENFVMQRTGRTVGIIGNRSARAHEILARAKNPENRSWWQYATDPIVAAWAPNATGTYEWNPDTHTFATTPYNPQGSVTGPLRWYGRALIPATYLAAAIRGGGWSSEEMNRLLLQAEDITTLTAYDEGEDQWGLNDYMLFVPGMNGQALVNRGIMHMGLLTREQANRRWGFAAGLADPDPLGVAGGAIAGATKASRVLLNSERVVNHTNPVVRAMGSITRAAHEAKQVRAVERATRVAETEGVDAALRVLKEDLGPRVPELVEARVLNAVAHGAVEDDVVRATQEALHLSSQADAVAESTAPAHSRAAAEAADALEARIGGRKLPDENARGVEAITDEEFDVVKEAEAAAQARHEAAEAELAQYNDRMVHDQEEIGRTKRALAAARKRLGRRKAALAKGTATAEDVAKVEAEVEAARTARNAAIHNVRTGYAPKAPLVEARNAAREALDVARHALEEAKVRRATMRTFTTPATRYRAVYHRVAQIRSLAGRLRVLRAAKKGDAVPVDMTEHAARLERAISEAMDPSSEKAFATTEKELQEAQDAWVVAATQNLRADTASRVEALEKELADARAGLNEDYDAFVDSLEAFADGDSARLEEAKALRDQLHDAIRAANGVSVYYEDGLRRAAVIDQLRHMRQGYGILESAARKPGAPFEYLNFLRKTTKNDPRAAVAAELETALHVSNASIRPGITTAWRALSRWARNIMNPTAHVAGTSSREMDEIYLQTQGLMDVVPDDIGRLLYEAGDDPERLSALLFDYVDGTSGTSEAEALLGSGATFQTSLYSMARTVLDLGGQNPTMDLALSFLPATATQGKVAQELRSALEGGFAVLRRYGLLEDADGRMITSMREAETLVREEITASLQAQGLT